MSNNDLPRVGAEAVLIHDKYNRDIMDVIKRAEKADKALGDISDTVDVKVNINDSEINTAIGLVNDLDGETPSVKVNVSDDELDNAKTTLNDIATIGAIDLAINIAGTAQGFFEGLGRFSGVGGILEMDTALASIEGRVGRMIPGAEKLIGDLYTNGWGESRTQIADVITKAGQLEIAQGEMAAATEAAFQVSAVTGGDVIETLNTMDTMVKSGLVGSFTEAADVMVTGLQLTGDKAGDLNDSFGEYATTFAGARISAQGMLSILNSGLDAGVFNTDVLADGIRESTILLGEMGTNPDVQAAFTNLDNLTDIDLATLLDEYNAGKIGGDEFYQGLFDGIEEAATKDPAAAQQAVNGIFGTQAEDLKVGAFASLTTDFDGAMVEIEGRAKTAGGAMSNNIGATVDTFLRGVEQMAVDWLSSDAVDLDGKIETFKTQLQTAMTTLAEGGSLGDAIEIAFGIPGVDTALGNIERVFGNLVIAVLEIVASIQDITGKDSSGTRAQISSMGEAQLAFDLKIANPEEFQSLIDTAVGRGVDQEKLSETVRTALDELTAEGNFDQVIGLVDEIISSEGITPENVQLFKDKYITPLATEMDNAIAAGDFDIAKKIADAQGDPTAYTDALKGKFGFDATSFDQMAADFTAGMETAIAAETPTPDMAWASLWKIPDDVTTSLSDFDTDVDTAMNNAALVSSLASDEMLAALGAMSDGVATADEQIALHLTENTVTTSFAEVEAQAAASFPVVIEWIDQTAQTVTDLDNKIMGLQSSAGVLASLAASVEAFPLDRLTAITNAAMGYGGAQAIVNNNAGDTSVTVVNNNTNGAQASTTTYDIAAAIGGG